MAETPPADAAVDWTGAATMMFRNTAWPGAADSPVGWLFASVRFDGGDGSLMTILTNNQRAIEISKDASNKLTFFLEDSGANQLVDVESTSSFTSSATWHYILVSWDLTISGSEKLRFYVGDTDEKGTVNTLTNGSVFFTNVNWGFGADWNTARQLNGSTGDFALSGNEFLDFDQESVRRMFVSASGDPIWLGTDGSGGSGTTPDLYMYGNNTTYFSNEGDLGGEWTYWSGGPANATSPPTRATGDNAIRLEHTASNELEFTYEHAGVSEVAQLASANLVAGTEYEIAIRKTDTSAELEETVGTISIFLDGTKGATEDVAAVNLTQAATSYLQIGALNDETQHAYGHFGEIMVSPIVFSDEEIADGGLP
jgi:hypothetical protein